jgi:hypothetical protein
MIRFSLLPFASALLLIFTLPTAVLTPEPKAASASGGEEPALVQGPEFSGVIFPANVRAFQELLPKGTRYWSPLEPDVLMAENQMVPFLQSTRNPEVREILKTLKTYKRQYAGIILAGHKQLYINLLCDTSSADWTRKPIRRCRWRHLLLQSPVFD